jgi:hypothetical protein
MFLASEPSPCDFSNVRPIAASDLSYGASSDSDTSLLYENEVKFFLELPFRRHDKIKIIYLPMIQSSEYGVRRLTFSR